VKTKGAAVCVGLPPGVVEMVCTPSTYHVTAVIGKEPDVTPRTKDTGHRLFDCVTINPVGPPAPVRVKVATQDFAESMSTVSGEVVPEHPELPLQPENTDPTLGVAVMMAFEP
jgi:hypothetical protein